MAAVSFRLNGVDVAVAPGATLLEALRDELGHHDVKDGCAPQGQCGCCTVLIDGLPRVACVTPVARVAGREVTTLDGLAPEVRDALVAAFDATAASQCGFCTPGIVVRLAALGRRPRVDEAAVRSALAAHLCRCTGFQPIVEAALGALCGGPLPRPRDRALATARATLESGTHQLAGPEVALGLAPFADDTAPHGGLVAVGTATSGYDVAASGPEARRAATRRPGRNSTVALEHPVAVPAGTFDLVLQTTWVEPAYLEPDASWCAPGGAVASPAGNGGAFGAKDRSAVAEDAARLAAEHGAVVRTRWTREAVVLRGEKRPPLAVGLRADGTGVVRLGWTHGSRPLDEVADAVARIAPGLDVEVVEVRGPRVGTSHRGAGVAEVLAALAVLAAAPDGTCAVATPDGATASVTVGDHGLVVVLEAGDPLCVATTRSYAIGAVHQGYSMVTTEGIALDETGTPVDLTIRSFGVTPARAFPHVEVEVAASAAASVAVGTAAFAATLASVWLAEGAGPRWPTRR
ncbi:MAG TPA: 2Fe-2S iron-sulfur cluster-binding protein [Acidimicrobiales bacterium]|nr:2Fe-2S iron-sulfur cluster-binding protein [Acidimicrobiales bacterium]